jgi:hypothetical protein
MEQQIETIIGTLNQHQVEYLLIGGLNFLLRHQPYFTYDVDIWINDVDENRLRTHHALIALEAEWGATEATWAKVESFAPNWLQQQAVFCLYTKAGSLDIFRQVAGLVNWVNSFRQAVSIQTIHGTTCWGISDQDMLNCQLALPVEQQKQDRIRVLRTALEKKQ